MADDRMCLSATYFHDRPPLTGSCLDLVDELAGKVGIAEFVQVLHDFTSGCPLVLGAAPAATSSLGAAPAATSSLGAAPAATLVLGAAPAATSSFGNASGLSRPACLAASSKPS